MPVRKCPRCKEPTTERRRRMTGTPRSEGGRRRRRWGISGRALVRPDRAVGRSWLASSQLGVESRAKIRSQACTTSSPAASSRGDTRSFACSHRTTRAPFSKPTTGVAGVSFESFAMSSGAAAMAGNGSKPIWDLRPSSTTRTSPRSSTWDKGWKAGSRTSSESGSTGAPWRSSSPRSEVSRTPMSSMSCAPR